MQYVLTGSTDLEEASNVQNCSCDLPRSLKAFGNFHGDRLCAKQEEYNLAFS